jgi:hypothetical protein
MDPILVAKALSYRQAESAVVRVRQVHRTGFEISLQRWDDGRQRFAREIVGYLVIERGRCRLADGTCLESGTVDTDSAYPVHSIAFSQSFHSVPVVMTAVTGASDSNAVLGRPTQVSTKEHRCRRLYSDPIARRNAQAQGLTVREPAR